MSRDIANQVWSWFSSNNDFLIKNGSNKKDYHKKLQKLSFMAYGIYLARYSEKMFAPSFEAWTEGPVCETIYAQIINDDYASQYSLNTSIVEILEDVNYIYGCYSADALSEMTHSLESWFNYYKEDDKGKPMKNIKIPDKVIRDEFKIINENIPLMKKSMENIKCQLINDVTVKLHKEDFTKYMENYEDVKRICNEIRKNNEYTIFVEFEGDELLYEVL